MNADHYEKVKRVLAKSEAVMTVLVEKRGLSAGMASAVRECEKLWSEEFPKEQGYGKRIKLDLSSADFYGGLFAGHGMQSGPLNGANLQDAKLDRTRWLSSDLKQANLTRANLSFCNAVALFCDGSVFRDADLSYASIGIHTGAGSEPADFTNANFTGATIKLNSPIQVVLTGANMSGCKVASETETPAEPHGSASYQNARGRFLSALTEEQRAQMNERSGGACFIATAAHGTDKAEDVVRLRAYREAVLRHTRIGRMFIAAYEALSPPLARFIARSAFTRSLARALAVRPARRVADSLLNLRREEVALLSLKRSVGIERSTENTEPKRQR